MHPWLIDLATSEHLFLVTSDQYSTISGETNSMRETESALELITEIMALV